MDPVPTYHAGSILVCLTGLLCPALYFTGFLQWRQKQA